MAVNSDATLVYEDIAVANSHSTCEVLWKLLSKSLCNDIQESALRELSFAMNWNENRNSLEIFAWRLGSASLLLSDVVTVVLLLNRLKNGLPNRLQNQNKLVSGTFEEVESRVSSFSSA